MILITFFYPFTLTKSNGYIFRSLSIKPNLLDYPNTKMYRNTLIILENTMSVLMREGAMYSVRNVYISNEAQKFVTFLSNHNNLRWTLVI